MERYKSAQDAMRDMSGAEDKWRALVMQAKCDKPSYTGGSAMTTILQAAKARVERANRNGADGPGATDISESKSTRGNSA